MTIFNLQLTRNPKIKTSRKQFDLFFLRSLNFGGQVFI